jgi:hypothetical protein
LFLLLILLIVWVVKVWSDSRSRGMNAWLWALLCFFIPFIGFPLYYMKRKEPVSPEPVWKPVYSHHVSINVQIVQDILQDNEIESVIMDLKDSNYHFGSIQLFVNEEDYDKARDIITTNNL